MFECKSRIIEETRGHQRLDDEPEARFLDAYTGRTFRRCADDSVGI